MKARTFGIPIALALALAGMTLTAPNSHASPAETTQQVQAQDEAPPSTTFNTPGAQTFTVPAGVTAVGVQAIGGGGGGGMIGGSEVGIASGGAGAKVTSIVPVTPGQVLTLTSVVAAMAVHLRVVDRVTRARAERQPP